MAVRVRFPSEAHQSLLEVILRGIFVYYPTMYLPNGSISFIFPNFVGV